MGLVYESVHAPNDTNDARGYGSPRQIKEPPETSGQACMLSYALTGRVFRQREDACRKALRQELARAPEGT